MKRVFSLAAITIISIYSSCVKENFTMEELVDATISVATSEDGVKTYMKSMVVEWGTATQDKVITVFDSKGGNRAFTATPETSSGATKKRTFTGKIASGSTVKYILWPQDNEARLSEDHIYTTLTNSQVPSNLNSFSAQSNVVVAKGEDSSLHNILGYIKFTIPAKPGNQTVAAVDKIVISTNTDGEYFAGDVNIDYSGEKPTIALDASGSNKYASITTGPRKSSGKYQPSTYYASVLPGDYHGISITVTPNGGSAFTISSDNTLSITAGKYTNIGTIPAEKPVTPEPDAVFGKVTQISTSTNANALFKDGDILYMGDKGHIYVYDLSFSRVNPKLISTIEVPGLVRQLTAKDGVLYSANRETGLYIFNVSNPASPKLIKRFDTIEFATGIDIAGNVLFVSQRQNGVEFIDVSDPSKAAHIDIIATPESQSCFYKDGFIYSGEWAKGQISVITASDMSSISKVNAVNLQGYGDGVYASGNLLFASTGHSHVNETTSTEQGDGHGMEIFDITDPSNPIFLSRVEFDKFFASGNDYWTCRPSGDGKTVYCADTGNGVYAVDITDTANPSVIGHFTSPASKPVSSIAVGDGYIYVSAYGDGLYSVKSSKAVIFNRVSGTDPANVSARKAYTTPAGSAFNSWVPDIRSQVHSAAAYGDALFVACGDGGLAVLKQNADGTLYKFAQGPSKYAGDVKVSDGNLYVAEGTDGMAVYRISAGPTLNLISRVSDLGEGAAYNIALWMYTPNDKYVVVGARYGGYIFMAKGGTAEEPTFTTKLMKNSYNAYNKFTSDMVCGGDAFPLITKYGLTWFDLSSAGAVPDCSDPSETTCKTKLSEGISNFKDGKAVYVHNNQLHIVASNGKTDESASTSDERIFGIPRWDGGDRILMSGTTAKKVSVVNVSAFPSVTPELFETTTGQPEAGIFWNGKAVIPCGYQGLLIEK